MTRLSKLSATALVAFALGTSAATAQETIKIGGIAPLSPPGGVQTGESLRDGMTIAVDEINQAGGLLGKQVGDLGELPSPAGPIVVKIEAIEKIV